MSVGLGACASEVADFSEAVAGPEVKSTDLGGQMRQNAKAWRRSGARHLVLLWDIPPLDPRCEGDNVRTSLRALDYRHSPHLGAAPSLGYDGWWSSSLSLHMMVCWPPWSSSPISAFCTLNG